MTVLYFAYGSNMLTRRLRDPARAPSARVLATGYVTGRRLVFDKAGQDGSGKPDSCRVGRAAQLLCAGEYAGALVRS
jgi:hypothetical protein